MTNLQQIIKEKQEDFDKKFYKNHANRKWFSRAGESYDSEHPEMGRAELFKFIFSDYTKSILAGVRREIKGMRDNRDMQSMFFSKEDRLRRDVNNQALSSEARKEALELILKWAEENRFYANGDVVSLPDLLAFIKEQIRRKIWKKKK